MQKLTGFIVVATALASSAAFADKITFKRAHVTIDVPDNWSSTSNGDQITLTDKHEDVGIAFGVIDAGAVHDATKAARQNLRASVEDLTFSKPEPIEINGMSGFMFTGDGMKDGVNIDLAVLVLDTPADDRDLMVIALGEDAKLARHEDEIQHIFRNLRPRN